MSSAIVQQQPQAGLAEQIQYATAVAKAGLLPQAYRGRPADIIVAMGLGQSMGLSPMESIYRIDVIQGKPTASAELIAAQVRKAGHKLRLSKDEQRQSVTATIVRADDPGYEFSVTRDRRWAQQMGLIDKDNYRKQPMTMLTWRAITAVAREACPEALYGVAYTPDEMHDLDGSPAEARPEAAPEQAGQPADLTPIRARFKAFEEATGLGRDAANGALCAKAGVAKMGDLPAGRVGEIAAWMDEQIENARPHEDKAEAQAVEEAEYEVPDLMPEEVDF